MKSCVRNCDESPNISFLFEAKACLYAWDFLTNDLKLPADRLYVTYFCGDESMKLKEDRECRDIWIKLGYGQGFCLEWMHRLRN